MKPCSRICAKRVQQRAPEAADVGQHNGLGVTAELNPAQLFDEFLQCADATGERNEGVGALEHNALARMHVGDD